MLNREELLRSKDFWLYQIQNDLYCRAKVLMEKHNFSQLALAIHLDVSLYTVRQILKGDYNPTISQYIKIMLAMGYAPMLTLKPIEEAIEEDCKG